MNNSQTTEHTTPQESEQWKSTCKGQDGEMTVSVETEMKDAKLRVNVSFESIGFSKREVVEFIMSELQELYPTLEEGRE